MPMSTLQDRISAQFQSQHAQRRIDDDETNLPEGFWDSAEVQPPKLDSSEIIAPRIRLPEGCLAPGNITAEPIDQMSDNQDVSQGAAKFDGGKVRVDLVPSEFTYATAATLTYGAIKYEEWNWAKGLRKGRIMAALMRHGMFYMMGEELDKESGLPHTWHMSACLAMLIASEARGTAIEDRQFATAAMDKMEAQFANMKDPRNAVSTP